MKVECKNYIIFKIRIYADKKLLDKWISGTPLPKQQSERSKNFLSFFWSLVAEITGHSQDYMYRRYMFRTIECATDWIQESDGILIKNSEEHKIILIPKTNIKLIEFVEENLKFNKLPFKVLSRISLFSINNWLIKRNLNINREESDVFTNEMKEKFPNLKENEHTRI